MVRWKRYKEKFPFLEKLGHARGAAKILPQRKNERLKFDGGKEMPMRAAQEKRACYGEAALTLVFPVWIRVFFPSP
jgi:hypothetical protein